MKRLVFIALLAFVFGGCFSTFPPLPYPPTPVPIPPVPPVPPIPPEPVEPVEGAVPYSVVEQIVPGMPYEAVVALTEREPDEMTPRPGGEKDVAWESEDASGGRRLLVVRIGSDGLVVSRALF